MDQELMTNPFFDSPFFGLPSATGGMSFGKVFLVSRSLEMH
jgi:hypothetical protein